MVPIISISHNYCSQITITNIIIMKKFKILTELLKFDTETQSGKNCQKNGTNRFVQYRVTTNLESV